MSRVGDVPREAARAEADPPPDEVRAAVADGTARPPPLESGTASLVMVELKKDPVLAGAAAVARAGPLPTAMRAPPLLGAEGEDAVRTAGAAETGLLAGLAASDVGPALEVGVDADVNVEVDVDDGRLWPSVALRSMTCPTGSDAYSLTSIRSIDLSTTGCVGSEDGKRKVEKKDRKERQKRKARKRRAALVESQRV